MGTRNHKTGKQKVEVGQAIYVEKTQLKLDQVTFNEVCSCQW